MLVVFTLSKSQLMNLKEGMKWYSSLPTLDGGIATAKVGKEALANIMKLVPKAFEAEVSRYKEMKLRQKDSDQKWIAETIKSGTLSGNFCNFINIA